MKAIEIAFVGYPVTDLERARKFYGGTLELDESRAFDEGDKSWIEYDIGPGTLAITNMMPEWKPSMDGGAAALEVENFDEAVAKIKADGVKILAGPFESSVCNMMIISDPDGNALTIHKRKSD